MTMHQPAQPQLVVLPNAVRGEGGVTTTSETLAKSPLGRGGKRRLGVREQRECRDYIGAIGAALQRQRALADSGQAVVGIEQCRDAIPVAQALETGRRENNRRILAVVQFLQPRVHIAAKRLDVELRIALAQLSLAAQARGTDDAVRRHFSERRISVGHPGVTRVVALHDSRQHEAGRHVHRHILERVHCEIGAAVGHRLLELLDEKTLAADIGKRLIDNAVALRRQAEQRQLTRRIVRMKMIADVLRLPHRQGRFAGGDDELSGCRKRGGHQGNRTELQDAEDAKRSSALRYRTPRF
jgi:hypothetical protein